MEPSQIPDLEAVTANLLRQLACRRDTMQQGAQIQRLQAMLAQIDETLRSIAGVIPDSDPGVVKLKAQRSVIKQHLEDIEVIAPIGAFDYASALDERCQSNPQVISLFTPFSDQHSRRRALQITGTVLALMSFTLWIGCLRLNHSIRQGPYLSNSSSPPLAQ